MELQQVPVPCSALRLCSRNVDTRPFLRHSCCQWRLQSCRTPTSSCFRPQRQTRSTSWACRAAATADVSPRLQELGEALSRFESEEQIVSTAHQLARDGVLRGFGQAQQVPKRLYTLEELRLNKVEPEKYLSPEDKTLDNVRTALQASGVAGLAAAFFGAHLDLNQLLAAVVIVLFVVVGDAVGNGGAGEGLLVDTVGRVINKQYGQRVACHEAGHFLVAYLLGLLPRAFTLSAADALRRYGVTNIQAGTQFCDAAFQAELSKGSLSSTSLDKYSCIALSGIAAEFVQFGKAEGGLNDIQQLDGLLRALGFTQKKTDGQVRWAVLNTTSLLRRHEQLHRRLAEAMASGRSVIDCIALIEDNLRTAPEI